MKSLPKQPLLMFPIDLSEKIFFAYNCVCVFTIVLYLAFLFFSCNSTLWAGLHSHTYGSNSFFF